MHRYNTDNVHETNALQAAATIRVIVHPDGAAGHNQRINHWQNIPTTMTRSGYLRVTVEFEGFSADIGSKESPSRSDQRSTTLGEGCCVSAGLSVGSRTDCLASITYCRLHRVGVTQSSWGDKLRGRASAEHILDDNVTLIDALRMGCRSTRPSRRLGQLLSGVPL